MLELENLEARYGMFRVLRGINLRVGAGELVAVVGSNGAGKTTMLRCISGLLPPSGGAIRFEQKRIDGLRPCEVVRRGLIQIPEGRQLFPDLTVAENLLVGASTRQARLQRHRTLKTVYELFPRLAERSGQRCGTLSGGEQQMTAIGRGLMGLPKLLVLDEPSLGLSPGVVKQLFPIIGAINRAGCSVLLVEQNVSYALRISDRAYVIENGAVQLDGPSGDLMKDPGVAESYFGLGAKESL